MNVFSMILTPKAQARRRGPGGDGAGGAAPPAPDLHALVGRCRPLVHPFASSLARQEQQEHACRYVAGLLSSLPRKTAETIAYHLGHERHGLQHFLGVSPWAWQPMLDELARQAGPSLAEAGGIAAFSLAGFAKKGSASVGVQRQCLGPAGEVGNGQVAVYLAYASGRGAALLDVRLHLPREWAADRRRRRRCGVPACLRYRAPEQLALEMLRAKGPLLDRAWVTADPRLGRLPRFRQALRDAGERYLVAVPPDTPVRWLGAAGQAPGGPDRRRFHPALGQLRAVPGGAWAPEAEGPAGPNARSVEVLRARVEARTGGRHAGPEETLVVLRRAGEQGAAHDFYLSNAAGAPVAEFLAAARSARRAEDCLRRAVAEVGLGDYEVRTWAGWHHHQTLALVAAWMLARGALRREGNESQA
jgi:SRSO17 transposase